MSDEAKWYVVHTYSAYESKVASTLETKVNNLHLQDLIKEIRVPTERVIEVDESGVEKEVERKVYPGYVFIKMVMNDQSWYVVRNVRGCTGFVGTNSQKPDPISEEEVIRLGIEERKLEVSYEVGDSVLIIDGPLDGFVGTVEEIDMNKNLLRVKVSMFGRETPVELGLHQVEPVE